MNLPGSPALSMIQGCAHLESRNSYTDGIIAIITRRKADVKKEHD
jgi:hypothetical protein